MGWPLCSTIKGQASQVVLVVKNPPANAEDVRDLGGFDPWVEKIPGVGHGNPLQYSCLENPMDRGAWRATVHRVTNSRTRLKRLNTHAWRNRTSTVPITTQQIGSPDFSLTFALVQG